jgi:hypothetical protein
VDDETFDEALAAFSRRYSEMNARDHAAHDAAIQSGRLAATTGV